MFKNYFKIISRNLWRNKFYTLLNIVGLGVGIAAIVWGWQTYRFSFSYNNFHKNQNEVFRVLTKTEGRDNLQGICPLPLATQAKLDYSSVQQMLRWDSRGLDIKSVQGEPFASEVHFTDPGFFEFFNFPLIEGNGNLNNKSGIIITEKAAKKFFGNATPIGKTLLLYSDEPYKLPLTVIGIMKDPPVNSSLQFEMITHFENQLKPDGSVIKDNDWSWFADAVFLKLAKPGEASRLSGDFKKYLPLQQAARKDRKVMSFYMEPLSKIADHDEDVDSNALMVRPEDSATFGPLVLAILILLSACLNFANTTVALSNRRLKEMGVRKVMGSSHAQVIIQQLMECLLIVLLAAGLSVLINKWWLPVFNSMFVFIDVQANYLQDYGLMVSLLAILLLVTLFAGGYPAFYISKFKPSSIFRGTIKFGGSNLFSRILLGLQIIISFITVIAGVAFARNSEFQRNYDFGYEKDRIVYVNTQTESAYTPFRNEIAGMPGVEAVAGSNHHIGFRYRVLPMEAKGMKKEVAYLEVGDNYLEVMNLKLKAGEGFNYGSSGDYDQAILINEKMAFDFGWKAEEAIGLQLRMDSVVCTIKGVLKDFTMDDLFDPLEPVAFRLIKPEKSTQLIIRAKPGSLNTVYDQVKATWTRLYPLKPFRGYYQSETFAESRRVSNAIAQIFFWFAIVSVVLAATGMFALVSLTILKRMKEVAIRKVVGAGASNIFFLLAKGYMWIFIGAALLGCYAGYSLSKLLMDMIFRINAGISNSTLWTSFACVFLIAITTIGLRVWSAYRTKASDVLKAG